MLRRLTAIRPEFLAAPLIFLLFVVILVPLPALFLDALLVLNMAAAFLLVLLAVTTTDRAQLSVFPTLILGMTLWRLALNVASTRLILTEGASFGGVIVRAFGAFVVGGQYAVGVILFAVLVCIQYLVVAKGSERVAEVAARFRLDGLPLKQMGIEARAQDGSLSPEEAEVERRRLQQEADFYGAMDGSMKFVKGETMAGFMITGINFVGGLCLGFLRAGPAPGELMRVFALLTVGDGLVGLVPSLMLAVSAGLVITRTEGEGALSSRVLEEFLQSHQAVGAAFLGVGFFVSILGAFSGVDLLGFSVLAVICFGLAALFLAGPGPEPGGGEVPHDAALRCELHPALLEELTRVHPGGLEVNLRAAAQRLFEERGVRIPDPAATPARDLDEGCWRVCIHGVPSPPARLDAHRFLAILPGESPGERLPGDPDRDPFGHRPALLVEPDGVGRAMGLGCQVMDPVELLGARVSCVLVERAHELLGHEETEAWLKDAARRYPAVLRAVKAGHSIPVIHGLLTSLLREGVGIRHPARILEALSHRPGLSGQPLVEAVRADIGRLLVEPLRDPSGELRVLTLAGAIEAELKGALAPGEDGGEFLDIAADLAADLISGGRARAEGMRRRGLPPVLVVSRRLRPHMLRFLGREVPDLRVLAYEEAEGVPLRVEARLDRFERPAASIAG